MFKPGDVVEFDPADLQDDNGNNKFAKYKGLLGIVVRDLGCWEDLAGGFRYIVSWDWTDSRVFDFMIELHGYTLEEFKGTKGQIETIFIDQRVYEQVLKLSNQQGIKTSWEANLIKTKQQVDVAALEK